MTPRPATAMATLLLVSGAAQACVMIGEVPDKGFILVRTPGSNETARIEVGAPYSPDCDFANPIALDGDRVAWAEPDASGGWDVRVAGLDGADVATLSNVSADAIDAVGLWAGHVAWHPAGAMSVEVASLEGKPRRSVPLPGDRVAALAFDEGRVAATVAPGAPNAPQDLTILALENGASVLPPTPVSSLGFHPLDALVFLDGEWIGTRGRVVRWTTGEASPLTVNHASNDPQKPFSAFVGLDGGHAYAYEWPPAVSSDSRGTLRRAALPSGAWSEVAADATAPTLVEDGRLASTEWTARKADPPIRWIAPPFWPGGQSWLRFAQEAWGVTPEYAWGDVPLTSTHFETEDGENYSVSFVRQDADGTSRSLDLRQRVARQSEGTMWIAPADLHFGVELHSDFAVVLLGPPGALPDAATLLARLGIEAALEPAATAPPLDVFAEASDRFRFALDCPECSVLRAAEPGASGTLNSAHAWVLPNGSLVAFRATPWIDLDASPALMPREDAEARLARELERRGFRVSDLEADGVSFRPGDGARPPLFVHEWALRLKPTTAQPWSHGRAQTDAQSGDLLASPASLTLDPNDLGSPDQDPPPATTSPPRAVPFPGALLAAVFAVVLARGRRR